MQTTDIRYSREIHLDPTDLHPGDQVDLAVDHTRWPGGYWQTVTEVTTCSDENSEDAECDGDCVAVLLLVPNEPSDLTAWHLTESEAALLAVRLPAS